MKCDIREPPTSPTERPCRTINHPATRIEADGYRSMPPQGYPKRYRPGRNVRRQIVTGLTFPDVRRTSSAPASLRPYQRHGAHSAAQEVVEEQVLSLSNVGTEFLGAGDRRDELPLRAHADQLATESEGVVSTPSVPIGYPPQVPVLVVAGEPASA